MRYLKWHRMPPDQEFVHLFSLTTVILTACLFFVIGLERKTHHNYNCSSCMSCNLVLLPCICIDLRQTEQEIIRNKNRTVQYFLQIANTVENKRKTCQEVSLYSTAVRFRPLSQTVIIKFTFKLRCIMYISVAVIYFYV